MIDLKKLRKQRGMSQFNCAVLADMTVQGLCYLESKNIMKANFGTIVKLAKVLDFDLNEFKKDVQTYERTIVN
jgi:transcriptional regulator with XRE-family HTH domain